MMKKTLAWVYILAVFTFIYTPILVLTAMSFNESEYRTFPFKFSLKWYELLSNNTKLIEGALNSVYIATLTAVICVVLAITYMLSYVQAGKRVRKWLNTLTILPLTIPWIIFGLALLLLLNALGFNRNMFVLLMGHVVISFPYAALVVKARMQEMDLSVLEASYTLGANEWTTFLRVMFPMIFPAVLAGAFLAFMISVDNYIISYFLIPPGISVLPVEIYSSIKFGFTPEINAVSTIIVAVTLVIILLIISIMRSSLKNLIK